MKFNNKSKMRNVNGKMKRKKGRGKASNQQQKDKAEMNEEEMFSMEDQNDSDLDEGKPISNKKSKKTSKKNKKKVNDSIEDEELDEFEDDSDDLDDNEDDIISTSNMSRKEYLEKLKKDDPEFYTAMMQSSELLDLGSNEEDEGDADDDDDDAADDGDDADNDDDDTDGTDNEDEEDTDEEEYNSKIDKEEDYDSGEESDMVLEEGTEFGGTITSQMIEEWEEELNGPNPLDAFLEVQKAFKAVIEGVSGGADSKKSSSENVIRGSQNFNAIVKLCLRNMTTALRTIFQLKDANHLPIKSKKWPKHKTSVKTYFQQLIVLTDVLAEPSVAEAVLKRGVLPIINFYSGYSILSKNLARRMITFWATSDEKIRVLAFMALFRLAQAHQGNFLNWMLKKMYLAYVKNCKFTSPSTWAVIDFMRISLVEMYSLDSTLAYRHAFVYIRQMAIHLRNAILMPKKENVQLVYNWQYIHCLNLWCDLLGKTHPNPVLQPMMFPVTQVAIGTIKLQQTQIFFPLAFHICRMLTELTKNSGTFIPVLPFLLEMLNKGFFVRQPKKSSLRPLNWMCMLRLSRAELKESAFKDGLVEQVCDIMAAYLSAVSSSIGFPDFIAPIVLQLKAFLKKCKSAPHCRKIKQILDKIEENTVFVENRRKDVRFSISDSKAIKDWEISVKQAGTPLSKFYSSWKKTKENEEKQKHTSSVSIDDYDLPSVKKRESLTKKELQKQGVMFDTDDEDDDEEEDNVAEMARQEDSNEEEDDDDDDDDDDGPVKKKAKTQEDFKIPYNGVDDVVKEFNFSDADSDEVDDDYGVGSSDSES